MVRRLYREALRRSFLKIDLPMPLPSKLIGVPDDFEDIMHRQFLPYFINSKVMFEPKRKN